MPADWDFAESERTFSEIFLGGSDAAVADGEDFITKEILRTGEWDVIPTGKGHVKRPLKIVREGKSNAREGVISMSEIVENFKAGAIQNVQIPLSDDANDHKNITATNTGYVRDIWITGEGDDAKLVAKMQFTEPEVREKILRGTYSDVSCGIPWAINSQGKSYGSTLEHVAITNRPFVDGLGPFMAASDVELENVEVLHFSSEEDGDETVVVPEKIEEETPTPEFSFSDLVEAGNSALSAVNSSSTYSVSNATFSASANGGQMWITDTTNKSSWQAPYQVKWGDSGTAIGSITLGAFDKWQTVDEGDKDAPVDETTAPQQIEENDLEAAQSLRELRFSEPAITRKDGPSMPNFSREELDRLDLSDDQRAAFQTLLQENVELSATARAASADERVSALEEMGFKEKPGFLKFYREVMLSDDGGPAVVLLSDGEQDERLTALEILDRAIDSLSTDGQVNLSDQALVSGNDDPPPPNADEELVVPVAERTAAVKEALGLGN